MDDFISRVLSRLAMALRCSICVLALGSLGHGAVRAESAAMAPLAEVPASLKAMADEAKSNFRRRIDPPPVTLLMFDLAAREGGFGVRRYLLRSHDEAIDALLAESLWPQQTGRVERALHQIVRNGDASIGTEFFSGVERREAARGPAGAAGAAAAIRHGMALGPLFRALGPVLAAFDGGHAFLGGGPESPVLSAYQRAAQLEPDNPWNQLVIAWLGEPRLSAAASLAAGNSRGLATDRPAQVELYRQIARLEADQQAQARVLAALEQQLQIARAAAAQPDSGVDVRALTMAMNAVGDFHAANGNASPARSLYESALTLREQAAHAAPDSVEAQVDLIASHDRLRRLPEDPVLPKERTTHIDAEFAVYKALSERDRYTPMIDPANWPALASTATVAGSSLTLIFGVLLLLLYRLRIGHWMKAAAMSDGDVPARPPSAPASQAANLQWRSVTPPARRDLHAPLEGALAGAMASMRRAAWVQTVAAMAFATVATLQLLTLGDVEVTLWRFLIFATIWMWPWIFVLGFLWSGDRRRMAIALGLYFAVLALQIVRIGFSATPPLRVYGVMLPGALQALFVWASSISASVLLLLFLNRSVRNVGPVLLLFMVVVSLGGLFGHLASSSYAGRFWTIRALDFLHLPIGFATAMVLLAGALLSAPFAWLLLIGVRAAYRAKWISDQTLVFDAVWLYQTLVLVLFHLVQDVGMLGWVGLFAFLAYRVVAALGMLPAALASARRPKARLLLLRVFGFRRRTERFFDVLATRWRYAGPIQMIAAPDLASKTIDPEELMAFLSGRLRQRFIIEPGDLQRRLESLDERPDADGQFRVNEFFCGNDTWRAAVKALMARSEGVVMDLRGFSASNQGCIFELQALLDIVPLSRIVLLVDRTTDEMLLRATLETCSQQVGADSPNAAGGGTMTLLDVGRSDIAAVTALLHLAGEWFDAPPRPAAPGQPQWASV